MKKILVALSAVVLLVLLTSPAFASVSSKKTQLSKIGVFSIPPEVNGVVNVENKFDTKLKGVHVTMLIPELGIRRMAGPFSIASGEETTKRLLLDTFDAEPGEYYVRITVSNDDVKRVRHRIVTI